MVLSKRTRSPLLGCIPNGRLVFLARRKSVGLGELSSSFGLGELGVNDTKFFFFISLGECNH